VPRHYHGDTRHNGRIDKPSRTLFTAMSNAIKLNDNMPSVIMPIVIYVNMLNIIVQSVFMLLVIILSVIWLNVMLTVNMRSVIKLTGIILSVIMLNVVTPCNAKADI
jgi:hypothetical protein